MITLSLLLAILLAGLYGTLLIYAGFLQIQKKNLPTRSSTSVILLGLIIDVSIALLILNYSWAFMLLILGLLGIQIVALYNGWYLYKRVNYSHQSLRLLLTVSIIFLMVI